jgi:hypothetical protein
LFRIAVADEFIILVSVSSFRFQVSGSEPEFKIQMSVSSPAHSSLFTLHQDAGARRFAGTDCEAV